MNICDTIYDKITATGRNPFLFIGAGITRRYLNTENWEQLLRKFALEYSGDEFKYDYYKTQIDESDYYGIQPKIASLLEKDFNKAVLSDDRYKNFRNQNKDQIQSGCSALKLAISEYMKNLDMDIDNDEIKMLKNISKNNISGIITTNYDLFLENLFEHFKVYVGQEELIFSDIYQIGEIYKIHGSANNPETLVLTSEDYQKFEETEQYLIAKILTIFLEYPIIFLGYSISDRNILNILKSITKSLSQEKLDFLKERFIFVEYSDTVEEISSFSQAFENGKKISMLQIKTNNFLEVYKAIKKQKALYSPKVLRQLREDIYNLAVDYSKTEASRQNHIVATGIQGLDILPDDKQIIIGVGVLTDTGYEGVKANDIYEDSVLDNKHFDFTKLIKSSLPNLMKSNNGGLPVFKYLSQYNEQIYDKLAEYSTRCTSIDSFLNNSLRKNKPGYRKKYSTLSVSAIIQQEGFDSAYSKICFLNKDEIDISELKNYLFDLINKNTNIIDGNSNLKRLIRIYDYLNYKK